MAEQRPCAGVSQGLDAGQKGACENVRIKGGALVYKKNTPQKRLSDFLQTLEPPFYFHVFTRLNNIRHLHRF